MANANDYDKFQDRGRSYRLVLTAVIALVCAFCADAAISFKSRNVRIRNFESATELPTAKASFQDGEGDYSKFLHTNAQHARLPCLVCHRRQDNSPQPVRSVGHSPCSGCHAKQFADSSNQICTICHANPSSKAVKPFPSIASFSVVFDHARHSSGAARPAAGCAACHKSARKGVASSIPDGFDAHTTCFQCHTNGRKAGGRDISGCNTCHAIGRPVRTSESARAFSMNFSHADHAPKVPNCVSCHAVRAGLARGRQVASPVPLNHHAQPKSLSCMTCHNNERAFGSDDFKECTRCHNGNNWRF